MRVGSFLMALCLLLVGFQLVSPLGTAFSLEATADVKPDTLNLMMKGRQITVYIALPENYDESDIDPSTILLEDLFEPEWSNIEGDKLMVKFDASSVTSYLWALLVHMGFARTTVDLRVTGSLRDGMEFAGVDTITIMIPKRGRN